MNKLNKTLFWAILFSIAMGFMESAVVIYLREIYYKTGFQFPLVPIDPKIARVEFLRELATIIMLVGIGYTAGKNILQRFAYFSLSFAIWDIFYYVFLYVFLGWPYSLNTWDILFLIPFPWVGPVWAPCLISLLMIVGSIFAIQQIDKNIEFKINKPTWILLISGALLCIVSFMWDYLTITPVDKLWNISTEQSLFNEISTYVPQTFNYSLFSIGFLIMLIPVCYTIYKIYNTYYLTTKTSNNGK
jgi:hypothetical protein